MREFGGCHLFFLKQGHAWISVADTDTGTKTYYGLWPDDHRETIDNGAGTDVRKNLETDDGRYRRYYELSDEQEKKLNKVIRRHAAWRITNTCASWASEAVYEVTGEDVDADDNFGFETPRELGEHIEELEKDDPTTGVSPKPPPTGDGGACCETS